MGEHVSRMAGYVVTVIMLLLGLFLFMQEFDRTLENNIMDITMEFVNECQTTGKIDTENYSLFTKKIYRMGNYTIEMNHKALVAWPETDAAGAVTGYKEDYYETSTQDILDQMYTPTEDKNYEMKNGDILTVKVRRRNNPTTSITSAFFGVDLTNTIVVRYSGTIGNSNQ